MKPLEHYRANFSFNWSARGKSLCFLSLRCLSRNLLFTLSSALVCVIPFIQYFRSPSAFAYWVCWYVWSSNAMKKLVPLTFPPFQTSFCSVYEWDKLKWDLKTPTMVMVKTHLHTWDRANEVCLRDGEKQQLPAFMRQANRLVVFCWVFYPMSAAKISKLT